MVIQRFGLEVQAAAGRALARGIQLEAAGDICALGGGELVERAARLPAVARHFGHALLVGRRAPPARSWAGRCRALRSGRGWSGRAAGRWCPARTSSWGRCRGPCGDGRPPRARVRPRGRQATRAGLQAPRPGWGLAPWPGRCAWRCAGMCRAPWRRAQPPAPAPVPWRQAPRRSVCCPCWRRWCRGRIFWPPCVARKCCRPAAPPGWLLPGIPRSADLPCGIWRWRGRHPEKAGRRVSSVRGAGAWCGPWEEDGRESEAKSRLETEAALWGWGSVASCSSIETIMHGCRGTPGMPRAARL